MTPMARSNPKAALPMLLAVIAAAAAALWVVRDSGEEAPPEAAAPRTGDIEQVQAEEGAVTLRAPQDPPPPVATPEPEPPPPEPQGFEEGARPQLEDWTWKHGQYDAHEYRRARAELARELAQHQQVPPERQRELEWLQEQIAQQDELSGEEAADEGGEEGNDEDGGG